MNSQRDREVEQIVQQLSAGQMSRRQFLQRLLAAGVSVTAANALLAACAPTTAPAAPVQPAAATPAPGAAAPAAAPSFAGQNITVSLMQSGTYDKAAEAIQPTFQQATGAGVEFYTAPWATMNQSVVQDLTTGAGDFDVITGEYWIANVFDKMLPLDDFLAKDNIIADMLPNIAQPGPSAFYDGKRIGIPFSAEGYGLAYRTDLFEAAGLEPAWTTFDELFAVADELRPTLPSGVAPISFSFGASEQAANIFFGAYPGRLINKDNQYKIVDREEAIKAFETVKRLVDYGPENALALSIDEANAVFLQGNAAILIGWLPFVQTAADDPNQSTVVGKWARGYFPGPGFPILSCWNMFISSLTESPELSWEWVKAYCGPETAKDFFINYGMLRPTTTFFEDAELKEKYSHYWPETQATLARAKAVPMLFEANDVIARNNAEMFTGQITPEECIERTEAEWANMEVPPAISEMAAAQGLKEE